MCGIYCFTYLKVPDQGIDFLLLYLKLFLNLGEQQPLHATIFSIEYHQWTCIIAIPKCIFIPLNQYGMGDHCLAAKQSHNFCQTVCLTVHSPILSLSPSLGKYTNMLKKTLGTALHMVVPFDNSICNTRETCLSVIFIIYKH